jgi:hypothetical protein
MLYTALAVLAIVSLVPLFVLGATGSWRHAAHALREYGVAMTCIVVPTVIVAAAIVIAEL